jgi:hypothetical protein
VSAMDGHDEYRTSSFSGGGSCVEVAMSGNVSVRHSARPDEATLVFTRPEWAAFVKGVKNGEFDPT